ncbi:MAG: hypothetical protein R3B13_37725 [Polyangiaceae bacterium]
MTPRFSSPWYLLAIAAGALSMGCETGGVGDPCIPEDEYQTTFPGYSADEVNVESKSFQCETRVCLVNHFQGRVSCPYGQTEQTAQAIASQTPGAAEQPAACRIPGTSGKDTADGISVKVNPQFVRRQTDSSVYCSCRCKNAAGSTDDGARYCDCPSGFTCSKLLDDLGLGSSQLAGFYCIKDGTSYNKENVEAGNECLAGSNPDQKDYYCGGNGANPPTK